MSDGLVGPCDSTTMFRRSAKNLLTISGEQISGIPGDAAGEPPRMQAAIRTSEAFPL